MPPESGAGAQPAVGIVVVNWHGREQTLRCLEALSDLSYSRWHLVLVDNESRDFSAAEIEVRAPGARYLRSEQNLGFAGGSNLGMGAALEDGADYVWFLNSDARPEPESLAALLAVAAREPRPELISAKILRGADPRRLDSVALRLGYSGRVFLLGHGEEDRGQYDDLREPTAVTACALLVRRDACERLGGFDERYFAYLEDADLCLRARAAGMRIAFAPAARVHHDRAAATADRQSNASLYYTSRNHLFLFDRHGAGGRLAATVRRIWIAALNIAYCARLGRAGAARRFAAVWQGIRDYRRGRMGGPWTEV